jgi:hypothetical protein
MRLTKGRWGRCWPLIVILAGAQHFACAPSAASAGAAAPATIGQEDVRAESLTVEKAEAELESAAEVYSFEIDGASFSPTDHRKIMQDLQGVEKACAADIVTELFRRESSPQFSKQAGPQFLNCQFDAGVEFINENMKELMAAAATNDPKRGRGAIARVLHAVQEFYANTNYVELMASQSKYASSEAAPILELWTEEGQKKFGELVKRELLSGQDATLTVSGPSQCTAPVPRSQLSKISPLKAPGAKPIERWQGMSQYQAARNFAVRASSEFITHARSVYPGSLRDCSVVLLPWWE